MTNAEKQQVQYLLTQYLEGDLSEEEKGLLFFLLDKDQNDGDWVTLLEELIASEATQENYDRERWEGVLQSILTVQGKEKDVRENVADTKKQDVLKQQNLETKDKVVHISYRKTWLWPAAVAAVLIAVIAIWFIKEEDNRSITATQYGQLKKISLPDKTQIVLNAHSAITCEKHRTSGKPREVWLKGDAYFNVKHTNTDSGVINPEDRFIVHTRLADIEVLGTIFNVRERRGKTEIVLEQGKIKVSFTRSSEPNIIMQPGQIVTVTESNSKAVINTIKPEEYTAWTKNKLVLTNASFGEIVEYMEDNFGKHIILSDPQLANRKVEGTFKIDNLDDALLVLSKALNVDIVQQNDTLIFTPK